MWVEDNKVKSCFRCQHDFSFSRRRHHCRKCGKIFCYECIRKRTIHRVQAKICRTCEELYDQYTKNLAGIMRMTQENQRELEKEQALSGEQNLYPLGPHLPKDLEHLLHDDSHKI